MDDRNRIITGYALTLASAMTFAAKGIFAKLIYSYGVDPVTLLALRFAIAMPLFWGAVILFPSEKAAPGDILILIASGAIGLSGAAILDFYGLVYVDASIERVILYTYPSIVVVLSALVFKERMGGRLWLAIAMVYIGLAMTLKVWAAPPGDYLLGAALIFASAVIYAVSYVVTEALGRRVSAVKMSAYTTTAAGFVFIGVWMGRGAAMPQEGAAWPLLIALAAVSTFVPALTVAMGIKMIGASRAALTGFTGPVATAALAYVILGERLDPVQLSGMAIVAAGVVFMAAGRRV
ncbi:MAG: DMT family transporter [Deltaproteobacteria bacterium]|nr:DMT family transporter [Deltaproteobacteria bacterium]